MTAPAPLTRKVSVPQPSAKHEETLTICVRHLNGAMYGTRNATPADLIAFLPLLDDEDKRAAGRAIDWDTIDSTDWDAMKSRAEMAESALAAMTAERDEARRELDLANDRATEERALAEEARADRDREHLRADNAEAERDAARREADIPPPFRREMIAAIDRANTAEARCKALEGVLSGATAVIGAARDGEYGATSQQLRIDAGQWLALRDALPAPSSASAEYAPRCDHKRGAYVCSRNRGHRDKHRAQPEPGLWVEWKREEVAF